MHVDYLAAHSASVMLGRSHWVCRTMTTPTYPTLTVKCMYQRVASNNIPSGSAVQMRTL